MLVTLNCQLAAAALSLSLAASLPLSLTLSLSLVLSPALLILDAQVTSIANCILYAIALCVFYRQTDRRTYELTVVEAATAAAAQQQQRFSAAPANCFVLCSRQATARFAWFLFGSVRFEMGYAHGTHVAPGRANWHAAAYPSPSLAHPLCVASSLNFMKNCHQN